MTKEEIAKALSIILDLREEDEKELLKMHKRTLERLFAGQRANALAYSELEARLNCK